jgi:hypothetical protein
MSYIKKFGRHPVTGAPLKFEDLVPLVFHKNADGKSIIFLLFRLLNS